MATVATKARSVKFRHILGIPAFGMVVLMAAFIGRGQCAEAAEPGVPVRIGWQVAGATQAQIVQVLKRTDIAENQGLDPTFVPFSYGEPQIKAALEGGLDVIFVGEQPAIKLIAQGGKWKILARLNYDRAVVMVPPDSPIRAIKDLKGKTVASAFGSTSNREALLGQRAAGLDANTDVRNVNMDIIDMRNRVLAGGATKWGEIDAVTVWDPVAASLELEGLARSLSDVRTMFVVAVADEFIARHPEAAVRLLVAVTQAWGYFSRNSGRVAQWYLDDIRLGHVPVEALVSGAKVDPNFSAKSLREIDMRLTDDDLAALERGAVWAQRSADSPAKVQVNKAVDQTMLATAMQKVASARLEGVQVVLPSARETAFFATERGYFFDVLPLWLFFVVMVLITLLAIEVGRWVGIGHRRLLGQEQEGVIGTVVGAVLGLLAFVIGLTFGAASNRFDARREALIDDVNAIGTAYLRAGLVPEPHRTATRSLLRDYVELRFSVATLLDESDRLQRLRARTAVLQESLWSHAEALAQQDKNDIYALFAEGLNEVFDLNTKRIALGSQYRIPFFMWISLIAASCVAMFAVGLQFGISGKRNLPASLALAMTFALVVQLIFDLDRPGGGMITLNQRPMFDLYQSLSVQK